MNILLFEAFASRSISAIEKFLNLLDSYEREKFISTLKEISRNKDIPLSNFKGEYLKAATAMKLPSDGSELIKFWFSTSMGFLGLTTTKEYSGETDLPWMQSAFIQNFIKNNVYSNTSLNQLRWEKDRYDKIMNAEFALVINITELQNGLRKLKDLRKERKDGAISFLSNAEIARSNRQRRQKTLNYNKGITNEDDIISTLYDLSRRYRCYSELDLIDTCYELLYKGEISRDKFITLVSYIEQRLRKRDGYGRGYDKYGYGSRYSDEYF